MSFLSCTYFTIAKKHKAIAWHSLVWFPGKAKRWKQSCSTCPSTKNPTCSPKPLQPQAPLKSWEGKIAFRPQVSSMDTSHRNPAGIKAQEPNSNEWIIQRWQEVVALLLWLKTSVLGGPALFPRASSGISKWIFSLLCRHRSCQRRSGCLWLVPSCVISSRTVVQPHQGVFSTQRKSSLWAELLSQKPYFPLCSSLQRASTGDFGAQQQWPSNNQSSSVSFHWLVNIKLLSPCFCYFRNTTVTFPFGLPSKFFAV